MAARPEWQREMWAAIALGLTAHAIMLRDASILDETSVAAILSTIDSVGNGAPPQVSGSLTLVAAFDERFDSLIAAGNAGAGRIGRGRHDLAAAAQRLVLRDHALSLLHAQLAARFALIDLAESHVFTLLPAWSGSSLLQPTNLAHFLTGVIAPLARASARLHAALDDLDRAPLGAASLAGPGLPVDRDETADLLGQLGPVESTFDAVSATDHLVAVAQAAAAIVAPMRSFLGELLLWLRTEPEALHIANELRAPADAHLPHYRPPVALEHQIADAVEVGQHAAAASNTAFALQYGPLGEQGDGVFQSAHCALEMATSVTQALTTMVSGPIEFNRAWLARNAGRGLTTAGELSNFLMAEEGLGPAAARDIAALTAQRAQAEGLEASAVTPAMIDAAALLVIGRELGIEIERLGSFLAPRRFIEKRTMLGGPAPVAVREYLSLERARVSKDQQWLEARQRRIAQAHENLQIRSHEILAAASLD